MKIMRCFFAVVFVSLFSLVSMSRASDISKEATLSRWAAEQKNAIFTDRESPLRNVATSGCCSYHGGVAYCGSDGYYWCNDGTRSPSCTCSSGTPGTPTPAPAPEQPVIFPSSHPSNAISASFMWYSDNFTGFFWRESDNVWVEFVPITSNPFVCSASFYIIQDKFKFDTVKLETGSSSLFSSSFCQDLTKSTVLKLTQWSFETTKADLNREFTLGLELSSSSGPIYEVVIPTPGLSPINECAVSQASDS